MPSIQIGNYRVGVNVGFGPDAPNVSPVTIHQFSSGSVIDTSKTTLGSLEINQQLQTIANARNFQRVQDTIVKAIAAIPAAPSPSDVWGYTGAGDFFDMHSLLYFAGQMAITARDYWLVRPPTAMYFLCSPWLKGDIEENIMLHLEDAYPGAKLAGETDLQMLERVYPAITWVANYLSSRYPGASVDTGGGYHVDVFYAPPAVGTDIVAAFKDLWTYTPSSGPPTRNGIEDYMNILTLLPLQF